MLPLVVVTALPAIPAPPGAGPYPRTGPTPRGIGPPPRRIGPPPRRAGKSVQGTAGHPGGITPGRGRTGPTPGWSHRDATTRYPPSPSRCSPDRPTHPAAANLCNLLYEIGIASGEAEFLWRRASHCGRPVGRCAKRKGRRKNRGCKRKYSLTHATSPCFWREPHRACLGARFLQASALPGTHKARECFC
jgi:hypothetical protein